MDNKNGSVSYKEYGKKFTAHTEKERERWEGDLKRLFPKIKAAPEEMYEMQALALSYRHMLADEIAFYMNQYYAENNKIKIQRRDRYVYYSTGTLPDGKKPSVQDMAKYAPIVGLRTSKAEKDVVIGGDLADQENVLELMDNHVDFLRECIKTIDHTLYGIKNKLELMRLLTK